ncbi:MAG: hypothetical protein KDK72_08240 [Chlamydiia bacterium]|nr:hypothetical protein [Chlamydiia bacterium]
MDPKSVVLEENQRFSNSILWNLQDEAYKQFGIDAWSQKGVPFYLTSNPHTAYSYAQIALGYIRDCLREEMIDANEPVYIFDLGAGSGRFGYLFLKTLLPLIENLFFGRVKICYVLTDIVETNVTFWQQHPQLKPWFEKGVLDCAFYANDQSKPLHLLHADKTLSETTNPLIIIGNYFFDTIPQDLFRIHNNNLEEGRVTITVEENSFTSHADPLLIPNLHCSYTYVPIDNPKSYYAHFPLLNEILEHYRQTFPETSFLFPEGGFVSIRYFSQMSNGRLLLLAGDQGVCTEQQIRSWGEPHIARHGTFSISVSYHAIAEFFNLSGGTGLLTNFSDPFFVVLAGVMGNGRYPETIAAFERHHDHFEPKDYWHLVDEIQQQIENPSLNFLILLLKLGHWDPINFHHFFLTIRKLLPTLPPEKVEELLRVIDNVHDQFFPICPEEGDFLMNLGVLYFQLGQPHRALNLFQQAQQIGCSSPLLTKNIAACLKLI